VSVPIAPEPKPVPQSVRVSIGPVALIEVTFHRDRSQPGTLNLLEGNGNLVSGPWRAVGKEDARLAAENGNPDADQMKRFGETPTGDYQVMDILPARIDPKGRELFGKNPVVRLRPISGNAAKADANGRTALLVHGGGDGSDPTDGSIRLPDEAMETLLAALPEIPAAARPRVILRVVEADAGSERPHDWKLDRPGTNSTQDARSYAFGRQRPSRVRQTASWANQGGYGYLNYDDCDLLDFYQQMYVWDLLTSTHYDGSEQGYDPYGQCLPNQQDQGPDACDVQGSVTDALSSLGFDVQPQPDLAQGQPKPDVGSDYTGDYAAPATSDPATQLSDGGWAPDTNAYGH
jgi:hypothetical protein